MGDVYLNREWSIEIFGSIYNQTKSNSFKSEITY